ncbi:MAG: HNH endonuclease [Geminicoccaceae bacterium]
MRSIISRSFATIDHKGVATDLATRWPLWQAAAPPGFTAFVVPDTAPLHELVREMWRLARALPLAPLRACEASTRDLPRTTEAERLVVQWIGQEVFRTALMDYWGGRRAVTGGAEPLLRRASHIEPWALCETDAERLDVYNGLLLAAHLDAAFDGGLIDSDDTGQIRCAERFARPIASRPVSKTRWHSPSSRPSTSPSSLGAVPIMLTAGECSPRSVDG